MIAEAAVEAGFGVNFDGESNWQSSALPVGFLSACCADFGHVIVVDATERRLKWIGVSHIVGLHRFCAASH